MRFDSRHRPAEVVESICVSTLLFGGHFRAALDPKVRFLNDWGPKDALSLIAAVLFLSLVFFVAGAFLRTFGKAGKVTLRAAFFLFFVQGLLVSLRPPASASSAISPLLTGLAWTTAAVLMLAWWRTGRATVVDWTRKAALLISPVSLILFLQSFPWSKPLESASLVTPISRRGEDTSVQTRAPVVFIVFDEWSFERSFTNSSPLPQLTALHDLAGRGFVCTNAWSGGVETFFSVPALLFQTTNKFQLDRLGLYWPTNGDRLRAKDAPNLTGMTGATEREVRGFYLPYSDLLGNTTSCRWHLLSPKGRNFGEAVVFRFLDMLVYWQDPWVESLRNRWYLPDTDKPADIFGPYWWRMNGELLDESANVLRRVGTNSFTFLHLPVPHPPFVFASDGSYQFPKPRLDKDPAQYHLNLLQMDRSLARLMAILRERGLFDRAMIVVTSDHSWRADFIRTGRVTDYDKRVRHVPLLVKWPGQTNSILVTNEISLTSIAPLLQRAAGGGTVSAAVEAFQQLR